MESRRLERLAALIRGAMADILLREISDPRLEGAIITRARLAPDAKLADVYWIRHGSPQQQKEADDGFRAAAPFIRRALAQRSDLRSAPQLRFHRDESYDSAERVSRLLDDLGNPSGGNEMEDKS